MIASSALVKGADVGVVKPGSTRSELSPSQRQERASPSRWPSHATISGATRLAALAPLGVAIYAALLFVFARSVVDEVAALVRPRAPGAAAIQAL